MIQKRNNSTEKYKKVNLYPTFMSHKVPGNPQLRNRNRPLWNPNPSYLETDASSYVCLNLYDHITAKMHICWSQLLISYTETQMGLVDTCLFLFLFSIGQISSFHTSHYKQSQRKLHYKISFAGDVHGIMTKYFSVSKNVIKEHLNWFWDRLPISFYL